jgi:hypothetical protein
VQKVIDYIVDLFTKPTIEWSFIEELLVFVVFIIGFFVGFGLYLLYIKLKAKRDFKKSIERLKKLRKNNGEENGQIL